MTRHCPTCGQHIPPGTVPVVDLNQNAVVMASGVRPLQPMDAEVLTVLAEKSPAYVPMVDIIRKVYGASANGDKSHAIMDGVYRLRKSLHGTRMTVERRRGAGYRLAVTANG